MKTKSPSSPLLVHLISLQIVPCSISLATTFINGNYTSLSLPYVSPSTQSFNFISPFTIWKPTTTTNPRIVKRKTGWGSSLEFHVLICCCNKDINFISFLQLFIYFFVCFLFFCWSLIVNGGLFCCLFFCDFFWVWCLTDPLLTEQIVSLSALWVIILKICYKKGGEGREDEASEEGKDAGSPIFFLRKKKDLKMSRRWPKYAFWFGRHSKQITPGRGFWIDKVYFFASMP